MPNMVNMGCPWKDLAKCSSDALALVNSVSGVNSVNSANNVNSYSAVLPPSPMVFLLDASPIIGNACH